MLIDQKLLLCGYLLKDKRLKFIFLREPNFQILLTREFTAKEDLNPRKQVFLLHLRLWPTQRPETKDLFYFLW